MRKILIFLIFVLLCFIAYMFFLKGQKVKDVETIEKMTEETITTEVINKDEKKVIKLKKESIDEEDVVNSKWMSSIKQIFELELFDDSDAYDDYQSMKASFEEDRMEAYDEFMDQVRKEKKSFNITELEDGKYKEIEEEYLKAFQKRYGQKVFLKYLEAIEKHNESNPTYPLYF